MAAMASKTMEYMIHHVFLPPELPGEGKDDDKNAKDHALIARLGTALDEFGACIGDSEASRLGPVVGAIKHLATLLAPDKPALEETLQTILPLLSEDGES